MSISQFKIRRKSDGLFSIGKNPTKFTQKGKTFKTRKQVENHIKNWIWFGCEIKHSYTNIKKYDPSRFEIVEIVSFEKQPEELSDSKYGYNIYGNKT